MALEKRNSAQVVTFLPPLPAKPFGITAAGSTSNTELWGGSGTDGRTYGWVRINTTEWESGNDVKADAFNGPLANTHVPVAGGEQFQLWTTTGSDNFPVTGNLYDSTGTPDAYQVYNLENKLPNSKSSPKLSLKEPTVFTVAGTRQVAHGSWDVYFSPDITSSSVNTGQDGIITIPVPRDPRWLNNLGHLTGVNYTFTVPGGPSSFTATLAVSPDFRSQALDPGRIVQVFRGGQCMWEGIAAEPVPSATGWAIGADGAATYGTNYTAYYDVWNISRPLVLAIDRGLRWQMPQVVPTPTSGNPEQAYLGPAQPSGSMTITDFLNLVCTSGRLYWQLLPPVSGSLPATAWRLEFLEFPTDQSGNPLVTTPADHANYLSREWRRVDQPVGSDLTSTRRPPDLYLISTSPVARTMSSMYNTLVINYQSSGDTAATSQAAATAAVDSIAIVDIPESVARYGRQEYYLDLSNGGTMSHTSVVNLGRTVLNKYVNVNYSNPFAVMPGQLLNNGGSPVDLGCDWSGKVCTVLGHGVPVGGSTQFGPLTFFISQYQYDDSSQTATVTPYQSARTDIATVVSELYPGKFA